MTDEKPPNKPPAPYPLGSPEGAPPTDAETKAVRERAERLREQLEERDVAIGPAMPIDPSSTVNRMKVIQWLDSHWKSPTRTAKNCLICGVTKWSIPEDFTWMATVGVGGSLNLGGDYFAFVPITCTNCGNTLFFNARIMGLLPVKKREEE
jgi:predicted nucleic-acid-binding Zn-ribbon protein